MMIRSTRAMMNAHAMPRVDHQVGATTAFQVEQNGLGPTVGSEKNANIQTSWYVSALGRRAQVPRVSGSRTLGLVRN